MKKRVLMISPPGFSPVRAYRGEGAFLHLPKLDPDIEILFPRHDEPWKDLLACDVVFCFRTFEEKYRRIAELALDMGKPVWFDMDDNVFAVRRSHPNYAGIQSPEFQNIAEWFVLNSNFITVSTGGLKDEIKRLILTGPLGTVVEIVPNAMDDYTLYFGHSDDAIIPSVHWRGGASHQEDLRYFEKEIGDIANQSQMYFHGFDPWWMDIPLTHIFPYIPDYIRYMVHLQSMKPKVVIVPLMDCLFNRCKSNIAALEAIWAGAIPIVPAAWNEWAIPGVAAYLDKSDLLAAFQVLTLSPEEHHKKINQSKCWLLENRVLSVVNQQRVKILERLVGQ